MTGLTGDKESPDGTPTNVIKEKTNVPSHQQQRRGVQRPPSARPDEQQRREVDGAPELRLPHQPRGGRRRRPRDQREAAWPDQRSRSGSAQRAGRREPRADG